MCGITGIFAFNLVGKFNKIHITAATMSLEKRGPDVQDIYIDEWVGLGHRRLSIIDTSPGGNQPMWDESGRYCIVFNGEIFNFADLRTSLLEKGVAFRSESDTEVLLKLYIREGKNCLNQLNGFFTFCVYDKQTRSFFVARDRYGIKPLLYLFDEDKFLFASEMRAMLQYGIEKTIDYTSLLTYLQLNYIPAPDTIFRDVKKLLPGHYLLVSAQTLRMEKWYEIPFDAEASEKNSISYEEAKIRFASLLETSVQRRLVSDVPLGAFLSGGIDSSVIVGLATRHKPDLHTFSIGFRDEKFFDETHYAKLVSKHFNTKHTIFSLTNDDLLQHVSAILNHLDEPFADSSAINVFILSKETRKHATVALSGDGADELLGGYNKHEAFSRMLYPGPVEKMISALGPLWKHLPQSRNHSVANIIRQLNRFAEGQRLTPSERYWRWAAFTDAQDAMMLLSPVLRNKVAQDHYESRKNHLLQHLVAGHTLNNILLTDMKVVLQNDMLVKVDLMSMAHGLEVRSPFLDVSLVDFVFTLPSRFKIHRGSRKRILRDAFRQMLPRELYNRPKKGFEVPMLKWFRKEWRSMIVDDLLSKKRVDDEGIWDYNEVEKLVQKLFSSNPGDVHARIWGLTVFQWWFRKWGQ